MILDLLAVLSDREPIYMTGTLLWVQHRSRTRFQSACAGPESGRWTPKVTFYNKQSKKAKTIDRKYFELEKI